MKKITLLLLALCFSILSFAQIVITGTIVNDSIPLESASVIIKNSAKGIATNSKGQFKIEAKKGDTLSISYLGYATKELVVDQSYYLKVKLESDNGLDEVVVNAYGKSKICTTTVCGKRRTGCGVYCKTVIIDKKLNNVKPKFYPNPSSNGIFQLKLTEDYDEVKITVVNISGQIVQEMKYKNFREKLNINLSQCSIGIYIVNIIADGKTLEAIKAVRS